MPDDLVERLRSTEFASATDGLRSPVIWVKGTVAREAADEIEKLRSENEKLRAAFQKYFGQSEATNVRAAMGEK